MTAPTSLPSPCDRPGSEVVVFDGDCQFCQQQVQRLNRLDRRQRLSYLSLHDATVGQLCPELTHAQLMAQIYLIEPDGSWHGGAAAFRYLTRKVCWLWPLAPWLHIPGTLRLWQALYRRVAKRRYRLKRPSNCAAGSCEIHLG